MAIGPIGGPGRQGGQRSSAAVLAQVFRRSLPRPLDSGAEPFSRVPIPRPGQQAAEVQATGKCPSQKSAHHRSSCRMRRTR